MTDVKNSTLYKTLKKAVRKEDHAELLRMLDMVGLSRMDNERLICSFRWSSTPQGHEYWSELSRRLRRAGHDCY